MIQQIIEILERYYPNDFNLKACAVALNQALVQKTYTEQFVEWLYDHDQIKVIVTFDGGEPVTEYARGHEPTVAEIVDDINAVDECVLEVYSRGKAIGWILYTNCNDPDESICDYSCSPRSQRMVDIIEGFEWIS